MEKALLLSVVVALCVSFVMRVSQPGDVLHSPASTLVQYCQLYRPAWLPDKVVFACTLCTVFWWVGLPVGILAFFYGGVGVWAVFIPAFVGYLTEFFTAYLRKV